MLSDLAGRRVTVMGLGRFGGGAGVTRWLVQQGADVLLTDLQTPEQLAEPLAEIADLVSRGCVKLRLGEHNVSDFTTCDLVIANPAVPRPWDNRFLRAAEAADIPITTEIRLLIERLDRARIVGITGSAGKSTTSAMIHHILSRAGHRSALGGNIGGSLLDDLESLHEADWIVLELSSAMLHWLGAGAGWPQAPGFSPLVAVLTNLAPNHLDWHGSFEHYQQSKLNIFRWQRPGNISLRGEEVDRPAAPIDLAIPGAHNQRNAALAITASQSVIDLDWNDAANLLADFPGLPHRLQLVAERDGLRFYNDSKSTTPEATCLAVESFDDASRIHLIAGGYDKGSDLGSIAALAGRIASLTTIGATGHALAQAATAHGRSEHRETLDQAVAAALARMKPGDILLLSPGCASWDQFMNYEARGVAFVRCIEEGIALTGRPT
jgi:UDP-N-acetylmuramoylalanine--D-glutamate ligase